MRRRLILLAALVAAVAAVAPAAHAASPSIVISQVYGGGGNANAPYANDYVELFNRGTTTVPIDGWSIQYASATGTGNFGATTTMITPLSGAIGPGGYLLVQEASNAAVGDPLPPPFLTDSSPIAMAAGAGKVALTTTASSLGCNGGSTACTAEALAQIVDLVGYGGANFFEGSGRRASSRPRRPRCATAAAAPTPTTTPRTSPSALRRRATSRPTRTRAASSSTSQWSPPAVAR